MKTNFSIYLYQEYIFENKISNTNGRQYNQQQQDEQGRVQCCTSNILRRNFLYKFSKNVRMHKSFYTPPCNQTNITLY
jgi:hypothetical protein